MNSGAAGWPNLVTGLHACVQTTHPFTNKGRVFLAPRTHARTKLTMNTDWRGQRQRAPGGLQEGQGMATEQVGLRAVESWCGCGLRYRKCSCWSGWGAGLEALRPLEAGGVTVGTRGGVMAWGGRRGCLALHFLCWPPMTVSDLIQTWEGGAVQIRGGLTISHQQIQSVSSGKLAQGFWAIGRVNSFASSGLTAPSSLLVMVGLGPQTSLARGWQEPQGFLVGWCWLPLCERGSESGKERTPFPETKLGLKACAEVQGKLGVN